MSSFKSLLYFGLVVALFFSAVKSQAPPEEEEEEEGFQCSEALMNLKINGVCTRFQSCCFDPREGCNPQGPIGCFMPNDCTGDINCVYTTNVCEACINDLSGMYSDDDCPTVNARRL